MRPRVKSGLLWGVVGGLVFLVLVQGYELLGSLGIGFVAKLTIAVAVGVVVAGSSYALDG